MELRPHQEEAVRQMRNGSVLWGGVGSGKTITSLYYYKENEAPRPLYVITTARKRDDLDWQKEAYTLLIEPTVDSWQNIKKYEEIKDAFFIFDEQRVVGSGAWYKAFIKIARNNRWILLSATPGDTWLDYVAVFVANGFYKNRTEFTREHVIYSAWSKFPKVDRYVGTGKLVRQRNEILVHMPYARHTNRRMHTIPVDYDEELFRKVVKERWHVYEERPIRNVSELFSVMRKVVNSDESRIASVRSLMRTHPRLIVFYNFDYELEMLRGLASTAGNTIVTDRARTGSKSTKEIGSPTKTSTAPGTRSEGTESWQQTTRASDQSTSLASAPSITESDTDESSLTSEYCKRRSGSGSRTLIETERDELSSPRRVRTTSERSSTKSSTDERPRKGSEQPKSADECKNGLSASISSTPTNSSSSERDELSRPRRVRTSKLEEDGTTTVSPSVDKDSSLKDLQDVVIAEWNGHKHEPIPDSERWIYLVQYTAGAEGWNCIDSDTVVFFSLNYSYKLFEQAQGRIDRLNTPFEDLNYYIFQSDSMIDKAIAKALGDKKSFNESDFRAQIPDFE